ncbi:homoserine kinase [Xylophilus sp.]|uniref:homoserine kinase n=1 Tax=Xylophilus sp. TaxID=2653893 RepID=UPI0013BAD547|nr:homoserine kinase [Xylophilus sp.]KAF1043784.1 MAG: Homoserine kinase [Xylophilus sp.]
MAVFTEVSFDEAGALLRRLRLGELQELRGIEGGIENTNYFATTRQEDGRRAEFVLTLFERLTAAQLPFYLYLMKHLALGGCPVPDPHGDASGDLLHTVAGKPAAVVDRLRGASQLAPQAVHCCALGGALARLHLAGRGFDRNQPNLRGLPWWNETVPLVLPYLEPEQAALLRSELAYQNHVAASSAYAALPRGPVHADLFRDNALFEGDELTGVFDFYFAGVDTFLFDLAVALNDWCVDLATGRPDAGRSAALLAAYEAVRPLEAAERELLPAMLRAGALRFWISRLWDFHLPREAALLKPHDPAHFERILRERARTPQDAAELFFAAA